MSDIIALEFRLALLADAPTIFQWKNDPGTRRASLDSREVTWEEHLEWFSSALKNPGIKIEIASYAGFSQSPVGVVRFNNSGHETELSWTVAPGARGRGIGKELVRAAVSRHRGAPLIARIKVGNDPSEAVARAAGFEFVRIDEGVSYWLKR